MVMLHPRLGLNPRPTVCPRCGKDGPELILLGAANYVAECVGCGIQVIGGGHCPKCHSATRKVRDLEEFERLPGSVCEACREKQRKVDEAVRQGGVYWRCTDCKSSGALRECDFSERVRLTLGKGSRYEGPCGVELSKRDCPVCGPNKLAQDDDHHPSPS